MLLAPLRCCMLRSGSALNCRHSLRPLRHLFVSFEHATTPRPTRLQLQLLTLDPSDPSSTVLPSTGYYLYRWQWLVLTFRRAWGLWR